MQVTLSGRAEELLLAAMTRTPGRSAEEILEEALVEQAGREHAPADARDSDPVWQALSKIPGIGMPKHWPPRFGDFEPIKVEGEPVSEQLIRERR
jgi:hypothetical protein